MKKVIVEKRGTDFNNTAAPMRNIFLYIYSEWIN